MDFCLPGFVLTCQTVWRHCSLHALLIRGQDIPQQHHQHRRDGREVYVSGLGCLILKTKACSLGLSWPTRNVVTVSVIDHATLLLVELEVGRRQS